MILIADNTKRKIRDEIREMLLSEGIPCAVCHTDDIDRHLPAGAVVVTERYIAPDVRYMEEMHRPRTPVFIFDEDRPLYSFVKEVYEEFCRKKADGEGYSHVSVTDKGVIFCNCFIRTTKSELRIIRQLLSMPEWHTAEKITLYCMKNSRSDFGHAAVHISNLNRKARKASGKNLIDCKRYLGYRISEICFE